MSEQVKNIVPDLIIGTCPLGCNKTCVEVWINDSIEHRIICSCVCHNNKKDAALVQVEGLDTKASSSCSHPGGISK
jgi:hypothetical protein